MHPSLWCHRFPLEPLRPSFETQTQQNSPSIVHGGFEAQPPKRHEYRTACVSPKSWTRVPPVLDRTSNTTRFATSSRECVFQVSATMASHPVAPVCQPKPNTRPSLLFVHQHEPAWPSCQSSTTILVLHTHWQTLIINPNHKEQVNLVFAALGKSLGPERTSERITSHRKK